MSYKTPPPGHQLCHAIYIWFYLALSLVIIKTLHDINDLVMCSHQVRSIYRIYVV